MGKLLCCILICASLRLSAAENDRIDPELRLNASGPTRVIVRFRSGVEPSSLVRFSARLKHRQNLHLIEAAVYEVRSQADLHVLESDPEVEFVAPDRVVRARKFQGSPDYAWMQTLGVSAPFGTVAYDGTGVGVALLDSGVNSSADLEDQSGKTRISYSANFSSDKDASDGYGHGTFVAGLIAGNGSASSDPSRNKYWVRGIAPNATIINLKVLDASGSGTDSGVINALDAITKLPARLNIKVINLSLGRPVTASCAQDALCTAVGKAWSLGYVVVVAAGNDGRTMSTGGYGTINVPANSPAVITVGASNTQGQADWSYSKMASYSSKGPTIIDHIVKPDLVASGNRLMSLLAKNSTLDKSYKENGVPQRVYADTNSNSVKDYFQLSGTSMAAGVTSGAVALVLQAFPNYTPDQVKQLLMVTAHKFPQKSSIATDQVTGVQYTSNYDIFTVGAGDLNVAAALRLTSTPPLISMESPTASVDSQTGAVTLVSPNSSMWGTNFTWGTTSLWGSAISVVNGTTSVWGSNFIWGTSGTLAFTSLWDSHFTWGTSTPLADAISTTINGEN